MNIYLNVISISSFYKSYVFYIVEKILKNFYIILKSNVNERESFFLICFPRDFLQEGMTMSDAIISTSHVKSTSLNDLQALNFKTAVVVQLMIAGGGQKEEAVALVNDLRSQVENAVKLNDFADRMNRQLCTVTGDSNLDNQERQRIISSFQQEADALGVDTSSWKGNSVTIDKEKAQSIVKTVENTASNWMTNVQNTLSKAVESLGKYSSYMSSTVDALNG